MYLLEIKVIVLYLLKHISNNSGLQNWFKSYCRTLTSCELYLDLRWFIFDDPGIYKWRKYWWTKTFCNYVMINLQTKLNIILQFKEVLVFSCWRQKSIWLWWQNAWLIWFELDPPFKILTSKSNRIHIDFSILQWYQICRLSDLYIDWKYFKSFMRCVIKYLRTSLN